MTTICDDITVSNAGTVHTYCKLERMYSTKSSAEYRTFLRRRNRLTWNLQCPSMNIINPTPDDFVVVGSEWDMRKNVSPSLFGLTKD